MPFVMLILEPREQRARRTPEEGRAVYGRMVRFAEDLKDRGLLEGVSSLRPDREGTRVTVREGAPALVDGPFTETKEMIGGFFHLACTTREEALDIARACPAAEWTSLEVREAGPCYED
ncbi:YciI family protein [Mesoterricola silvestris]|uniref:Dehydrogenase n=1 Tax=Mesoterricola silvestris TaxID=2927979 RepID=A0AA48GWL6_9BACT|nr:YciI family protein [Mesoterricola silvestris]BDU73201.1 dehydrogenase [Mesoterricola silvestris]